MKNIDRLGYALLIIVCSLTMRCEKGPQLIFPSGSNFGRANGFVSPAGVKGTAYLFEDIAVDSTTIDTNTGYFFFDSVAYGAYQLRIAASGFGIPRQSVYVNELNESFGTTYLSRLPSQVLRITIDDSSTIGYSGMPHTKAPFAKSYYALTKGDSMVEISITFASKMDSLNMVKALTVQPDIDYSISFTKSNNNDILTIHFPVLDFFKSRTVTVTLSRQAQTIYGQNLDFDLKRTCFPDTSCYAMAALYTFAAETYPYYNAWYINPDTDIVIDFRQKMNEGTIERAFSIIPSEAPNFFWSTTADGLHELRVVFPSALRTNTSYLVSIDSSARTATGIPVPVPLFFPFSTKPLQISRYIPANGAANVCVDSPLVFTTNVPIDLSSFRDAFSSIPPFDSLWFSVLDSGKTIVMYHPFLLPDTTYSIAIDTSLKTPKGAHLANIFHLNFSTGAAQSLIRNISPPDTLSPVLTGDSIRLLFTTPMIPSSVEQRLSINPAVPFLTTWRISGTQQLVVAPIQPLRSNTVYTVTVDSGYRSLSGVAGQPFQCQFKTLPIMVTKLQPLDGQINVAPEEKLQFTFNTPIDTAAFLAHFTMQPAVDSLRLIADSSGFGNQSFSIIHAAFAGSTVYTLTLDSAMTDRYGIPMGRNVSLNFSTKNR